MAVKIALEKVPAHKNVLIRSDSLHAIQGATDWHRRWLRESWSKAKGLHKEDERLLHELQETIRDRTQLGAETRFFWVKGHSDDVGNDAADGLAKQGSREAFMDGQRARAASRRFKVKKRKRETSSANVTPTEAVTTSIGDNTLELQSAQNKDA
ncbi:ribonuclease H-like domain-containing protein [Boeremia exigua]|uniref:ribonuclease H-like domain-containing protein n=1 Tax=Boeremia exigua TaxID=749465 RepID=UPI001E8EA276|nr:ribonuclease H-like domain-containing protein [Boeremia exigua]KAH6644510.1 ribonuclease H-like domain-containing protein [Boeremia exigua]